MICALALSHSALILLATDNGITFTDAPKSTKKLCTLKLKISKVNRNGGKSVFASIVKPLSTDLREPKEEADPLSEEVSLATMDFLSVLLRMYC